MKENATTGSTMKLIGQVGEFRDSKGHVRQCVVRGREDPPFEKLLIVDYVTAEGEKVCGANIGVNDFIPDSKTRPTPALSQFAITITGKCKGCGFPVGPESDFCGECICEEDGL